METPDIYLCLYKRAGARRSVSGWASGLEEGTCQPGWLASQAGVKIHSRIALLPVTATAEQDKEGQEDKIPSPVMYSFNYVLTPR